MELSVAALFHLADASVRLAILVLAAAAGLWIFRVKSASMQHALWTLVMAVTLLLPVLGFVLPPIEVRISRPIQFAAPLVQLREEAPPGAAPATSLSPSPVRRWTPAWQQMLFAFYLAGASWFLWRLLRGLHFARRLVRGSKTLAAAWAMPCLDRIPAGRRVALLESDWIAVPLTVGWLKPKILLPASWHDWDAQRLEAVLVHELMHVGRADWLVAVLMGLNRCLFWFHPLVWWLEGRLASLAEFACDDAAVLALEDREPYARALLDMAAAVRPGQGRLAWEAMAMAKPAQVKARIERILDETRQIPRGLTKARWLAVLACGLPLLYAASALQLEPSQTRIGSTSSGESPGFPDELTRGWALKGAAVGEMERRLEDNPEDLTARSTLLAHYFLNAMREPRVKHVFWLIENHPEAPLLRSRTAGMMSSWDPLELLNTPADYERARALWFVQVDRYANDPRVLSNAATFFGYTSRDCDQTERLLKRGRELEPGEREWVQRLAMLYAAAVTTALADNPGAGPRIANPAFNQRVMAEMTSAMDPALLKAVGDNLARTATFRRQFRSDDVRLDQVQEFGERLLERSRNLN